MQFKYFIYAEGHCGWADRLKWQLMSGSVPIVQSTTCGLTTTTPLVVFFFLPKTIIE